MVERNFRPNAWPSLGVEIELQLVDGSSMALANAIGDVLDEIPPGLHEYVKPEFVQSCVELNTDVCRTVEDVAADLSNTLGTLERITDSHGLRLFWAGTHPFSRWNDQKITPVERYFKLAALLQETVTRPVTFGMHVHVGVPSGDVGMRVMGRLTRHLPALLSLSSNSPYWHGRATGHHAHRIEVLEGFPTGGLPPRLDSWDDYCALVERMHRAGFIESHRELWWDVRPNASNGTIEVRICDMPTDLNGVLDLTALIQCLVKRLIDETLADPNAVDEAADPILVRQNRWRACRYGLGAELVDPDTLEPVPARDALRRMVDSVTPVARRLGCAHRLAALRHGLAGPSGAERQMAVHEQTGKLTEVIRTLSDASRMAKRDGIAGAVRTLDARTFHVPPVHTAAAS